MHNDSCQQMCWTLRHAQIVYLHHWNRLFLGTSLRVHQPEAILRSSFLPFVSTCNQSVQQLCLGNYQTLSFREAITLTPLHCNARAETCYLLYPLCWRARWHVPDSLPNITRRTEEYLLLSFMAVHLAAPTLELEHTTSIAGSREG